MYQLHYTIDNNKISVAGAKTMFLSEDKILEHYNITVTGIKHYEILTSTNHIEIPQFKHFTNPFVIRTKLETTNKPASYKYVERHYKTNTLYKDLDPCVMMAEVINPTTHKYILTLRAPTLGALSKLYKYLPDEIYDGKFSQEFCIYDSYEDLDYLHI